jgi:menaquinone-specific isochorismate synthase
VEPIVNRWIWAAVRVDADDLLDLAAEAAGHAFFLERLDEDPLELAGTGAAVVLEASGPERFSEIERQARRLFSVLSADPAAPRAAAPRLAGGFAFLDAPGGWPGFPASRWVLPERQAVRADGETWLTGVAAAAEDEPIEAARERLRNALHWPRRPREAPLPEVRREGGEAFESWRGRIGAVHEALRSGALRKVVLARSARFVAERPISWPALVEALRSTHEGSLVYAFAAPEGGAFLGATAERLVRRRGKRVTSCAMAGSAPRASTDAESRRLAARLAASLKDREEHRFVVDAVCEALAPLASRLECGVPAVLPLAHVQHLYTPIEAELREDVPLLDLARRLHPTPAVAGTPREAALAFLERTEPLARGWYTGTVGWIDQRGDGDLAVALRCARVEGPRLTAFVGAGIVEGSEAEAEWVETDLKLETVVSCLKVQP